MVLSASMGMATDMESHREIARATGGRLPVVSLASLARALDLSSSGARKFVKRHQLQRVALGHRSPRYRLAEVLNVLDELTEERSDSVPANLHRRRKPGE